VRPNPAPMIRSVGAGIPVVTDVSIITRSPFALWWL
jgi:hypothetical protein